MHRYSTKPMGRETMTQKPLKKKWLSKGGIAFPGPCQVTGYTCDTAKSSKKAAKNTQIKSITIFNILIRMVQKLVLMINDTDGCQILGS